MDNWRDKEPTWHQGEQCRRLKIPVTEEDTRGTLADKIAKASPQKAGE